MDGINRDISHKFENFKTIIKSGDSYKFKPIQNTNPAGYSNSNKRVLTQSNEFSSETTWEGFIITGGQTGLSEYGAGVKLMKNGHLKNCRIEDNKFYECGNIEYQTSPWGGLFWEKQYDFVYHTASNLTGGGGVYCVGGIVENCQIVKID